MGCSFFKVLDWPAVGRVNCLIRLSDRSVMWRVYCLECLTDWLNGVFVVVMDWLVGCVACSLLKVPGWSIGWRVRSLKSLSSVFLVRMDCLLV